MNTRSWGVIFVEGGLVVCDEVYWCGLSRFRRSIDAVSVAVENDCHTVNLVLAGNNALFAPVTLFTAIGIGTCGGIVVGAHRNNNIDVLVRIANV